MKLFPKRADKLAMLSKIVGGQLTSKDISDLRKSREPFVITLNLNDTDSPVTVNDPCFHIDVYEDGTSKSYWQYADGRIEIKKVSNQL